MRNTAKEEAVKILNTYARYTIGYDVIVYHFKNAKKMDEAIAAVREKLPIIF